MSVRKLSTASILSPSYKNSKFWDGETFPGYFESIQTVIVPSGGSANVTFSNIPQNYSHLQLRIMARASNAVNLNGMKINFNGDTNSNYAFHLVYGNGSNTGSEGYGSQTYGFMGNIAGASQNTGVFAISVIDILDYTNTNKFKTVRALTGDENNNATTYGYISLSSSLWLSSSAITSLTLDQESSSSTTNFVEFSHFALYGIRSA